MPEVLRQEGEPMKRREYEERATSATELMSDSEPVPPVRPPGDGWRLVAALRGQGVKMGFTIWYWQREVIDTERLRCPHCDKEHEP